MAEDILGRNVAGSIETLKSMIQELMRGNVGKMSIPPGGGDAAKDASSLGKILETIKGYMDDFGKATSFATKAIQSYTSATTKPSSAKMDIGNVGKVLSKAIGKKDDKKSELGKLAHAGLKKGSIHTHDEKLIKAMEKIIKILKEPSTGVDPTPDVGDTGKQRRKRSRTLGDGEGISPISKKTKYYTKELAEQATQWYFIESQIRNIVGYIGNFNQSIMGGVDATNILFRGLGKGTSDIRIDLRKTLYETQGITGEARNLQNAWAEVGDLVKETGVKDKEIGMKEYIKLLKKGIRDQKTATKIIKSQLSAEVQLGLEAGSLGDMFSD